MGVLASTRGLRRTTVPQPSPERGAALLGPEADQAVRYPERFGRLRDQLALYFSGGAATANSEPIDVVDATPFLRAAWRACRSIPFGQTRTYKWLAAQVGRPEGARAAGQCMARNRLPIIVPCHRVIASDGSLRGFGGAASQMDLKQRLLDLEARSGTRPTS